MIKTNTNNGLSKVALQGWFDSMENKVKSNPLTLVQLKPGGKITPDQVLIWANRKGFSPVFSKGKLYLARAKAA